MGLVEAFLVLRLTLRNFTPAAWVLGISWVILQFAGIALAFGWILWAFLAMYIAFLVLAVYLLARPVSKSRVTLMLFSILFYGGLTSILMVLVVAGTTFSAIGLTLILAVFGVQLSLPAVWVGCFLLVLLVLAIYSRSISGGFESRFRLLRLRRG